MKRSFRLVATSVIICCCLLRAGSYAQGTWISKPSMPGLTTRSTAVSFTIGTNGYIGTGYDENTGAILSDFWAYNPLTGAWTQKADYGGGPRLGAVGFAIGTKGYIGTGCDDVFLNFYDDFWEYDPVANSWTQKASFGGGVRALAVGFAVDSSGYIGTGDDDLFNIYQDMWKYTPSSDTWTQVNNFGGQPRSDIDRAVFVIGSNAYLGTGFYENQTPLSDFWKYNSVTDTWTQIANVPGQPRLGAVGFSICNKGFIGLGYDGLSNFYSDLWMYDPGTNLWTAAVAFPSSARDDQPSFVINDTAYIATGEIGFDVTVNDFWAYTYNCSIVPPVALFQTSDTVFCSGNCINYTDLSSNATSWQWNFPGGTPSSSTDENPSVCYYSTGAFGVTFIAFNSGGSDTLNETNFINVFASPTTPDIINSGDTLYCSTDPSYTTYQWYDSSTIIPGATDTFYVAPHSGNYNVQVTNENGCQIAVGITVVLGIQNYSLSDMLSLYPNPVTSQLTIHISAFHKEVTVSVINVLGQETSPPAPLLEERGVASIDISTLPAGMYFLQLRTESGSAVKPFVKE